VYISPDSSLIAWQVNSSVFSFDSRAVDIWVAALDGSNPRQAMRVVGGSLGNWFPDSQRVLITRRESAGADPFLSVLNIADGSLTDLVQSPTLRGGLVSPGGGWVAYQITLSGNADNDGFWVIPSSGGPPTRLSTFGPYRWRSEGKLIVVPFEYGTPSNRLVEIDVTSGETRALTDPATQPFRIANGDWTISPDGQTIVFLSADDRNLWRITLPAT
jgi:Tol biopolymer transport system component